MSNGQRLVAVKKLNVSTGEKEFRTEMKALAGTHHRNLVQLLGYCLEGPNRFLVYEYISNGSLANLLFTPAKWPRWDERMGIAQNLWIGKRLKHGQTSTLAEIRGTKGYIAPEWFRNQPVTVKVDVYSFGIMLLQIICCRKNFDLSLPDEEIGLNEWVSHCFEAGELGKLVDDEEVDKRELERMVKVGLWCIQDEPLFRPSIKKVLLMLEGSIIDILYLPVLLLLILVPSRIR
ncbi:G-type lectin S-receptor-like serine/threonine-protein kinase RLK1 [Vitis vinifera]|uniref:G-type lectin S-receptor-like serine/threonine-protein kinase RLK1 n=1 Tax=Vitis vinifera TaxID=29760 RepID=A0A438DBE2_VITVI|nr:G-type lectin S-receptor-like serine/threonine-protein kinase RLK1 [Vitis vinifera]